MACKLVYNNEGQFVKALTPDGRESSLFKQILSIPHIRSVKEASELYANIFSKKMYSIMGEKGAQNLDTIDNKLINDKLRRKYPIFTKTQLFEDKNQGAKKAFENYSNISLPMSANFYELEEIFGANNIEDILDKLPYNLIKEDYDVNEEEVRNLLNRYISKYDQLLTLLDEKNFRIKSFQIALQMENEGNNPLDIKLATGWERHLGDNRWRYEVPNGDFKITEFELNKECNMSNVFESDITKAYSDIKFKIVENEQRGIAGSFNRGTDEIEINVLYDEFDGRIMEGGRVIFGDMYKLRETILHELVHYVQKVEGFGGGGSPKLIPQRAKYLVGLRQGESKEVFIEKLEKYLQLPDTNTSNVKIVKATLNAITEIDIIKANKYLQDAYEAISGEVEARAVVARDNMFFEDFRDSLMSRDYELSIEDQIYLTGASTEPQLNFQSDKGNTFKTFKEALKDSTGGDMNVLFDDQVVGVINSEQNLDTFGGTVNHLIASNILSESTIVENGKVYLKAEGFDPLKQLINEDFLKEYFPLSKITRDGKVEVLERVKPSVIRDVFRTFSPSEGQLSEETLKDRMLNFLKEVGITVTSIDNYVKAYKIRNGVEPGAEAIADFANQVIAFKDGEIEIDKLSEETAHFIIENWDEAEIRNLTRNIHKTQTFAEFYQQYYEIYQRENPEMSAEELDFFTRKEILGKELAKSLQDRFDATNKEPNILKRIYELFAKFISGLTTEGNYKAQLEDLTEKVDDLLLRKDAGAVFQLKNKKFRMYSLPQTNVVKAVAEQEKLLARTGQGSNKTAKEVLDSVSKAAEKATTDSVVTLAKRQVKYVKEAVDAAVRRGRPLSTEESLVLNNLTHAVRPALEGLQAFIKNKSEYKKQADVVEKTLSEISMISGSYNNAENNLVDQLLDRIIERNPGLESKRDQLKAEIETVQRDTNYMYSYFGQVSHASDPILQMLAVVGSDIYNEARVNYNERQMAFNRKVRDLGFTEREVNKLVGTDGHIISKWNFEEFAEFERYARGKAYLDNVDAIIADLESRPVENQDNLAEHKAYRDMSQEEFLEKFEYFPAITNKVLAARTSAQATEIINQGEETTLSDAEVQKRITNNANLSDVTKATIRGFMETRAMIRKNMKTSSSGTKIYTLQNRHDMEYLNMERRKAMSIYRNEDAKQLKQGLSLASVSVSSESIFLETDGKYVNLNRAVASDEAVIAFEMLRQQKEFMSQNTSTPSGVTKKFMQDLEAMEKDPEVTREDLIDFIKLNTSVGFSQSFFDGEFTSVFDELDKLEDLDQEIVDELALYRESLSERKAILARYRDANDAINTLTHNMSQYDLDTLTMLAEDIESRGTKLLKVAKDKGIETNFGEKRTVKSPNKAYYEELKNQNLEDFEDVFNFTVKHLTVNARRAVQNYKLAIESGNIPERMESLVLEYGADEEGILKYAQSKMLPYYSSNAPVGLVEFYDNLRNSQTAVSDLVKGLDADPDVRLSVSYDYADSNSDDALNKFKDPDFRANTREPSLRKPAPTVLGRTFDFNNKEYSKLTPKLLELQKAYLDFQEENLKGYGVESNYNIYKLPQVERANLDKIKGLGTDTKATFKEYVERITTHRADEQDFGADREMFNAGIKTIPKKYLSKLNKEEVSTDLLYSSALLAQQVELYRARTKYFGEISALEKKLQARQFIGGKPVQTSNTYTMFKSAVDNMIFGIQETQQMRVSVPILNKEVDLSKVLRTLQRYVSNLSLAFNPVIPATSALTAMTAYVGEPFIKQYIDPESYKKGSVLSKKWMSNSMTDAGSVNIKSDAVAVGNHFGIFDLAQRYKNANYGKFVREVGGNAAYGLHTLGNFLPLTQAVAVTLTAHRFSNDKLVTRKEFAGTEAEWSRLKSVADYVENTNGEMTYSSEMLRENGITPEQWKNIELGLMARVDKIVERIDGQIKPQDRTIAQRNFLLSWTMLHKSYLAIGTANAFKGKQNNFLTGQVEQGKYTGALTWAIKSAGQRFNVKNIKDKYGEVDEADKVAARRVLVESGVLMTITILSFLIASGADDDEENSAKQLANYLVLRTKNETISSQAGIIGEIYKSLESPLVGLSRVKNIATFWNIFDSDEIKQGRYAGLSQREKYIIQAIPGLKSAYDLSDAKNIRTQATSYEFFNKENSVFNIFATMLNEIEEDENEE